MLSDLPKFLQRRHPSQGYDQGQRKLRPQGPQRILGQAGQLPPGGFSSSAPHQRFTPDSGYLAVTKWQSRVGTGAYLPASISPLVLCYSQQLYEKTWF